MRRVFSLRNVIIFLAALILVAYYGAFILTDYLWFASLGFQGVFTIGILSRVLVGAIAGLVTYLFILGNVLVARRAGPLRPVEFAAPDDQFRVHITIPILNLITYLGPLVVAIFVGLGAAASWLSVQSFLHATPFGLTDPFFQRDIGFYLFALPFYRLLYAEIMSLLVVTLLATALFYLGNSGIEFPGLRPRFSARAWRHLSVIGGAIVLLKAGGYFLGQLNLLYSTRGVAFGASYTDIHAQLPALRILMGLAIVVGVVIIVNGWLRRTRLAVYGLGLLVLASLVVGTAYPAFVQQFTVEPDEINKETPYIEPNIAFTRKAFDLDRVTERDYPVTNNLTLRDIQDDAATISNVRLWDWRPLRDSYGQLQAIRLYYEFADVDLDRYVVDGRYRQVIIAARELNHDLLPTEARTWMNEHLLYTHGYGVVMSPTTSVTSEGLPTFYIRDIPPQATVPDITVTRPEIYYGELTDTYAIVNTLMQEFDYPMGDQNQYSTYAGTGGVRLSNPLIRAAFALRLRSYQVLLANSITSDSRVLLNRNIHGLVRQVAPFLSYDSDPYVVIGADGRLFYIQDAYTTTNLYPYSQRHPTGINYIRNSVKVVIDAYNGTTTFYVFDEVDPIVATYAGIFPTLFKPASEMPADLKAHIRYPADLFSIQADMYATYHMQNPQVFYNREDLYERPGQMYANAERPQTAGLQQTAKVEPHYMILRLPGEPKEELVQMLPYSPKDKANMIAWIAARSDPANYGELLVYKFPKQQLVYGPMQVEARIDQDTTISQNLTLWNQAGSSVIRGTLLVIPIKNSIVYIEPLYLQASGNKLPELKRIIVAYGDRVVMTETLTGSLEAIFGQGAGSAGTTGGTTPQPDQTDAQRLAELARRANDLYAKANAAAKLGDWAAYGDYLTQLGQVLNELQRLSGAGAGAGAGGAGVPGGLGPAS
jgi:uncharacterized membrane protein (UPF0182 family)